MLRPVLLLSLAIAARATEVKLGEHTFAIPDGFEIQKVAGPPLVDRPITMAFAETGALYVADSSGSNDKVEKQLAEKPHRILRLIDRNGDGQFDDRTVFADKMMFPEGTMWLDGSLYVSAPPQIWKLTDTNEDGIADERKVWFDGKTLTGCANDLHGPYAGPDGYVYWCKGAFAEQKHRLADGKNLTTRASHLFRARPDGSGLEVVMTGGMDNPVDVVFTPSGERLVDGTFFIHPGGGKRDGILHAVHGGVWGKDHAVLDGHPRTGELMPIMTHLGPGAPSGLELLRSNAWGAAWRGNIFACNFNLHKVTRHVLSPQGATFKTSDSDFVVSDQTDFHPTDILEDADGSLLIADTGGWYKLCCPTSQLHKPDVLGAIYRVRKSDAVTIEDPRGIRLDWKSADAKTLAERLSDSRPVVTQRAAEMLGKMGDIAVTPLAQWLNTSRPGATTLPLHARLNALWALARIPGESARAAVRFAFADRDPTVRTAASHAAGLWRDAGAKEALINQLTHANLQLRRAAAEALGRIGDASAASAVAAAVGAESDRFLEHSISFALIELRATDAARSALKGPRPASVRVGLAALNQLGELRATELLPHLAGADPDTRKLAEWIAARHPEWGDVLADWLKSRVTAEASRDASGVASLLGRLSASASVQVLIGELATSVSNDSSSETTVPRQRVAFDAMRQSHLKELPTAWMTPIEGALRQDGPATLLAVNALQGFASVKSFPASLRTALEALAADSNASGINRVAALAAIPGNPGKLNDSLFALLRKEAESGDVMRLRNAAAQLARADLNSQQTAAIAEMLPKANAAALPSLLEIFRSRRDEPTSRILLEQLAKVPSLPASVVRSVLANHPESIRKAADALLASSTNDTSRARLDQLAAALPKGDVRRGHQLFQSAKSACSTCHAMAYVGGNLGPDLTKIGGIRTERDLLEAIVFPSASFVRSYEPVFVKTRSKGDQFGIVKRDDSEGVALATGPGTESQVARAEIASIEPAPISLMPQGYDGIFTPQELADLVAFLKAAK